jgi:hypothetical protein
MLHGQLDSEVDQSPPGVLTHQVKWSCMTVTQYINNLAKEITISTNRQIVEAKTLRRLA